MFLRDVILIHHQENTYDLHVLISESEPYISDFPKGDNSIYLLRQAKPGLPPAALYFLDRSYKEPIIIQILINQSLDPFLKAVYPTVTNHIYHTILGLNTNQLDDIMSTANHTQGRVIAKFIKGNSQTKAIKDIMVRTADYWGNKDATYYVKMAIAHRLAPEEYSLPDERLTEVFKYVSDEDLSTLKALTYNTNTRANLKILLDILKFNDMFGMDIIAYIVEKHKLPINSAITEAKDILNGQASRLLTDKQNEILLEEVAKRNFSILEWQYTFQEIRMDVLKILYNNKYLSIRSACDFVWHLSGKSLKDILIAYAQNYLQEIKNIVETTLDIKRMAHDHGIGYDHLNYTAGDIANLSTETSAALPINVATNTANVTQSAVFYSTAAAIADSVMNQINSAIDAVKNLTGGPAPAPLQINYLENVRPVSTPTTSLDILVKLTPIALVGTMLFLYRKPLANSLRKCFDKFGIFGNNSQIHPARSDLDTLESQNNLSFR